MYIVTPLIYWLTNKPLYVAIIAVLLRRYTSKLAVKLIYVYVNFTLCQVCTGEWKHDLGACSSDAVSSECSKPALCYNDAMMIRH